MWDYRTRQSCSQEEARSAEERWRSCSFLPTTNLWIFPQVFHFHGTMIYRDLTNGLRKRMGIAMRNRLRATNRELEQFNVTPSSSSLGKTCHTRLERTLDSQPIGEVLEEGVFDSHEDEGCELSSSEDSCDLLRARHNRKLLESDDACDYSVRLREYISTEDESHEDHSPAGSDASEEQNSREGEHSARQSSEPAKNWQSKRLSDDIAEETDFTARKENGAESYLSATSLRDPSRELWRAHEKSGFIRSQASHISSESRSTYTSAGATCINFHGTYHVEISTTEKIAGSAPDIHAIKTATSVDTTGILERLIKDRQKLREHSDDFANDEEGLSPNAQGVLKKCHCSCCVEEAMLARCLDFAKGKSVVWRNGDVCDIAKTARKEDRRKVQFDVELRVHVFDVSSGIILSNSQEKLDRTGAAKEIGAMNGPDLDDSSDDGSP